MAQRDLPALRGADLLLSRRAFLAAESNAAARQDLLDFLQSGRTLIALDTSTAEIQRVLAIEAQTATPAAGYRPQLAAVRLLGEQWSVGAVLTPEGAAAVSPAELVKSALSAMTAWDAAPAAQPSCERFADLGWLQFKHCPEYNYREHNTVCDLPRWNQPELAYRLWHSQQTTIGPDAFDGCEGGYYARQLAVQAQLPPTRAMISDWSPKNWLPASGVYYINLNSDADGPLWSWESEGVDMIDRGNPAEGIVAWSWLYPRGAWFQRPAAITGSFTSEPGWIEGVRCDAPDYVFEREAEYTTARGLSKKSTTRFAYTLPGRGEVCDLPAP